MIVRAAQLLCAVLLLPLLSACGSTTAVALSSADRMTITSVVVQGPERVPDKLYVIGEAESLAAIGGTVGAALRGALEGPPPQQLVDIMKSSGVDVPSIVKSEFQSAVSARRAFSLASSDQEAQGRIVLAIDQYGYHLSRGFSTTLYPIMRLTAVLTRRDGTVAWQRTDYVSAINSENKIGYSYREYAENPELMRRTMAEAARIVSTQLVASYLGD
jgi:hypothetical protein